MLFNSVEFLCFFVAVFCLYWLLPAGRPRVWLLLIASYYFYMSWNAKLAVVVAGSSLVDYFLALGIQGSKTEGRRKALLTTSIVMNLGLLSYFKYSNFFLDSLGHLLGAIGLPHSMPVLNVITPIGISFYTFEAISYTVDVYNRRTNAEQNPVNFLLFITFFPRMVAGPIIRAKNFLPQLSRRTHLSWPRVQLGMEYVMMGLFKKIAIADRMACLVDPVYQSPQQYQTGSLWVAIIAYSLQVYGDFSGYSDIAIGTAHMLGFKLPENFHQPYLARNIADFWRRWHISLSTWLRDYVFISLGGSRGTSLKTASTLMVTMTLCGLWHGAKWTLVGFGAAQGVMMLIHRYFRNYSKQQAGMEGFLQTGAGTVLRIVFNYWTFIVCLVIFRAPDFGTVSRMFHGLFTAQHGFRVVEPYGPWSLVAACVLVLLEHLSSEYGWWKRLSPRLASPAWGAAFASLLVFTCVMAPEVRKAFIYFQF